MPIDFRTHGYDWQAVLRRSDVFCALVTPGWHEDRLSQRQYTAARKAGKPIVLLVQQGARLPEGADDYIWKVWSSMEELLALVTRVESGEFWEPRADPHDWLKR